MEAQQIHAKANPLPTPVTPQLKAGERRKEKRSASQRVRVTFMGIDQVAANWSLGGVLLEDRNPTLMVGATISGLLSIEGGAGRYRFSAEIVRREIETKKLALRFVNPSPALLDVLGRDDPPPQAS